MEYPKYEDLDNLKLSFKALPIKKNWQFAWKLTQKISKSAEVKDNNSIDSIVNSIGQLINNFSVEEVDEMLNLHLPYIYVFENDKENQLNIDFHFNDKPYLVFTLLFRILMVYYKSFLLGLLKSLNLDEKMKEVIKNMNLVSK